MWSGLSGLWLGGRCLHRGKRRIRRLSRLTHTREPRLGSPSLLLRFLPSRMDLSPTSPCVMELLHSIAKWQVVLFHMNAEKKKKIQYCHKAVLLIDLQHCTQRSNTLRQLKLRYLSIYALVQKNLSCRKFEVYCLVNNIMVGWCYERQWERRRRILHMWPSLMHPFLNLLLKSQFLPMKIYSNTSISCPYVEQKS